ncbi:hypothetical protein FAVG1_07792 [Fusarium avenaceum]|nr:hypothetical protein FAVG1_07792 [Fusarium avenaceum]
MTKGLGIRQYRSCVRCRSRKTRCDLGSEGDPGKPPCVKCFREGAECVLADSRRGGDYSRYRRPRRTTHSRQPVATLSISSSDHISPRQNNTSKTTEDGVHDKLQNPSDALLVLAHAAGQPDDGVGSDNNQHPPDGYEGLAHVTEVSPLALSMQTPQLSDSLPQPVSEATFDDYPLISDGSLDAVLLIQLLRYYADNYHHFFPLVPANVLKPEHILDTIRNEPFLLTAILIVSSRDRTDLTETHNSIWEYMKSFILKVILGKKCVRKVGSVEGLLLLGEWTLHNQDQVDDGDEASAWSIIGLAISIRMGQAFWCRGPALSARFTARDFPALQPTRSHDEDFASFIQAQVELTTLFGNAHDILFASRSRTAELMMRGDYTKYVDDTMKAMYAWQHTWTSLSVSPHLKSCLNLMQEYLRLYVNAFAFQAVIYRASVKDSNSEPPDGSRSRGSKMFPDSAMASPDARHIYEAADAAEALIRIVTDDIHPEKYLRYMPARFYLYEIHSSVFLYKAHACGAISSGNHTHITSLMERFISVLKAAAVDDNHIAAAYAKLLDRLWFRRTHGLSMSNDITNNNTELGLGDQEVTDSPSTLPIDTNMSQMSFFDDFGFQPLEYTDVMDGLFSIPFVTSWDPTTFPNIIA